MKRGHLAIALSLLVMSSSAPTVQQTATAPVTIPFELENRHILVKARVNKSRPLAFVLDTGANTALVRMPIAKELQLSLTGTVNVGGAGPGRQTGSYVSDATWSLVGLERFTQPVSFWRCRCRSCHPLWAAMSTASSAESSSSTSFWNWTIRRA